MIHPIWSLEVGGNILIVDRVNSSLFFFCAADTVVLTHAQPLTSDTSYTLLPEVNQELLEKPISKADNLRMLLDLNGGVCEVVTGVSIGQ